MTFVIPFPQIDPVLVSFGPLAIRWYSLAYIAGLLIGWRLLRGMVARQPQVSNDAGVDDYLVWAALGVILGGRLGYVLFYNLPFYLDNPLKALAVWQGGMSFHGGLIGVVLATLIFCRQRKIDLWLFADRVACVAPVGLFFGRIANFINGELFGRVTDAPWAMAFPRGGPDPRHPSQLYEAFLEGAVLFTVLMWLARSESIRKRSGVLTGVFLAGYGTARMVVEFFRQPDAHLGFLGLGATMGQWLSAPLIAVGIYLIVRKPPQAEA
ncbi:MAG: prolipoprotein diacylglyceryl transferase [Rhodospirillales bacterium]|nr:prolipoprotein diacylglyceryl transferase [Rhodospirillales bacterium]